MGLEQESLRKKHVSGFGAGRKQGKKSLWPDQNQASARSGSAPSESCDALSGSECSLKLANEDVNS